MSQPLHQTTNESPDGLPFEALLSRLSATFIHAPADEVDRHVERGLGQVVDFLGIDRSSIAQFSADGRTLLVTHSHTTDGVNPMPRVDLATLWPWYTAQVRAGRLLRFVRLPDELPPQATVERESYRHGALPRSHLMIPFQVGDAVLGGIGFGSFREIDWPDELVLRLQLLGEVFANALARRVALEKEARLREQLGVAARVALMGELTASIAHEINQPLCALTSGAQALRRLLTGDPPDLAEARAAAEDVAADAQRAGAIVSRIRGLFRASAALEPLDLNAVVREVLILTRGEMARRGMTVRLGLSAGKLPVRGDRVGLQQVTLNLLTNAADAMGELPAGLRVLTVGTGRDSQGIHAWVRDCGPGLDPRHLDRVFDAFFTTKIGGLGMGLAVCRSIVQRHGGQVWATCEEDGGTTFRFTLPVAEGPT